MSFSRIHSPNAIDHIHYSDCYSKAPLLGKRFFEAAATFEWKQFRKILASNDFDLIPIQFVADALIYITSDMHCDKLAMILRSSRVNEFTITHLNTVFSRALHTMAFTAISLILETPQANQLSFKTLRKTLQAAVENNAPVELINKILNLPCIQNLSDTEITNAWIKAILHGKKEISNAILSSPLGNRIPPEALTDKDALEDWQLRYIVLSKYV